MPKKIIVLGCGLVGRTIARDLAADDELTVAIADVRPENLARVSSHGHIQTYPRDLSDPVALAELISSFDVVVGALASALGYRTLRTVIEAGKPYCDISFMPEDADQLDALAKDRGVTAIVDCGVAPGLSNLLAAYASRQLDETHDVDICVGGLPKVRRWPFEYKAPFAPIDVLAEYTRPSRVIVDGRPVTKLALSEPELIDLPHIGTLEAFITDGLRSLTRTLSARNMRERTLRFPGHCELMRVFRETGLFGEEPIEVHGQHVRPIDLTAALLFPKWQHGPNEPEFTVMRVTVDGTKDGTPTRYTYDLYDEFDEATGMSSMSRTTGFPPAILARKLASGELTKPGVFAPEGLADDEAIVTHVREELSRRGVEIEERVTEA